MTNTLRSLVVVVACVVRTTLRSTLALVAALLLAGPSLGAVNIAAQTNGGVATASTVYSTGYPVAAINNGDRKGLKWGAGGGWNDSTASVWPDWVQITFSGQKTINAIHVFTLQDSYTSPVEPTAAMVFTRYGITAFDIQYWNGTAWVTVLGGSISGNNAVWRQVSFPAITTDRIRVQVNASLERYSRITEIEAYDTAGPTNVPPTVSLTSPVNGASYTAPATINLSATASDSDGSIASVKFYRQGADQILIGNGTLTGGSYTYTWNNVAAGSYSLTAKATDNAGAVTTSAPVSISVTNPPPPPPSVSLYYLYADHLNTPRVATDSTNKVVWRWDSDAFGTSTANEDPDGDGVKFTYNPRFPGQYFDKETNLHYNTFRDYEPSTGRYVQSDPIGLAGGLNTYGYVGGNPLSYVDPDGLFAFLAIPGFCAGGGCEALAAGIVLMSPSGQQAIKDTVARAKGNSEHCCVKYKDVYQPNDGKHGNRSRQGPRGIISPEPTNGQATLNTSVPSGDTRLGHDASTGELVLFRRHYTDEANCIKYWHGYVVSQKDLKPDQWRAGRDAGFPDWSRKPK